MFSPYRLSAVIGGIPLRRGRWLALLALLINGCVSAADPAFLDGDAGQREWLYADRPHSVVVMTHGFNLAPVRMEEMAHQLRDAGHDVLQVSLTGHRKEVAADQRIGQMAAMNGFETWRRDIDRALQEATARAARQDAPVHVIGFSMGGLLSVDHMRRHPDHEIEAAVLLAPAVSLRWTSWLLLPLGVFPDFLLPSVGPDEYKANQVMPVSAYEALYDGVQRFDEEATRAPLNIPTLVLISPDDELVSAEGIEELIDRLALDNWQLRLVDSEGGDPDVLRHVIVDRNALGEAVWQSVMSRVHDFLAEQPRSGAPERD